MTGSLRKVAIVGGSRIPFCRSNTLYADKTNLDMMTAALGGLVDRFGLAGRHIDEVTGGAVVTHARDWNLMREAVLASRLARSTPGITMMQACGTSLQGGLGIAAKIATGAIDTGIVAGADTTSDPPIVVSQRLAKRLRDATLKKTTLDRIKVFAGMSLRELAPVPPSVAEPRTGLSMGQHCELMARDWSIGRLEQDQLAIESHRKATEAWRSGWMDDLVVPYAGVFRDNNLREDIDLDKLATLKPAFDKSGSGTITAANATPLTDGAAACFLAAEDVARREGWPVLGYLGHAQTSANDFVSGEGLLMAPTLAIAKLLDRTGLQLQDFDAYEIHEAFAAQVLATLRALDDADYCRRVLGRDKPLGPIDRSKLNVKGSSIAIGHPFAATGARILANAAKLVSRQGGRTLISICTAGGMGVAAIVEAA